MADAVNKLVYFIIKNILKPLAIILIILAIVIVIYNRFKKK